MQTTPDLYALGLFVEALVAIPLFLVASLVLIKIIDLISSRLGTFVRYLAFPGVVLHEVCHALLCRISGVPVLEHRIFMNKRQGVGGGVVVDTGHIRTFTTGFFVGFAPLIILAVALYLFLAFWALLPMHEFLKYYFIFCFFIGLAPSKADLQMVTTVAKEHPNQTLLELSLLSLPFLVAFSYLFLRILWNLSFSILIFGGAFLTGALLALLAWHFLKPHRNS